MFLFCKTCVSAFVADAYLGRCPHINCGSYDALVEVDEMLLPVIQILNKKGYYTKACCSGHYLSDSSKTYIMFEPDVTLPDYPPGFIFDFQSSCMESVSGTRKNPGETVDVSDMFDIYENIQTLLQWAVELPDYQE